MIKLKDLIVEAKKVKVPKFKTSKQVSDWLKSIPANAKVDSDIWDPETGEIFMEKGDTKAKLGKKLAKSRTLDWDKWDSFTFYNNRNASKQEFEEYFNVVYRDNAKDLTDEDKERLIQGDYAWDYDYPSKIKRKDGKTFTENDKENIEQFGEWYGQYVLSGGNIHISVEIGKKVAEGEPQYI